MAEGGLEALERLEKEDFDLILMDVQMPAMDGLEVTRKIREHANPDIRGLPIIGLTASVMASQLESYRLAGMDAVLAKPLEMDKLSPLVDSLAPGKCADGAESV